MKKPIVKEKYWSISSHFLSLECNSNLRLVGCFAGEKKNVKIDVALEHIIISKMNKMKKDSLFS